MDNLRTALHHVRMEGAAHVMQAHRRARPKRVGLTPLVISS
jgi:hypothetical protein